MKKTYYSLTIALSVFVIVSCSTESTPVYQLITSVEPVETGTVNPSSGEYDKGNQVQITATPNENWIFDRWSGGYTGNTNPTSITMNSDMNITALFVKREYPLTVNTEGEGTVNERVIQAKTTDYTHGTTVELTANPSQGWEFVEWLGDLEGDLNPSNITVEEEISVTAVFQKAVYKIEISVEGEGNIIIDPIKETYEFGDIVKFSVEPEKGWSFVRWDGSFYGTQNPHEVSITQNLTISVILDENPFAGGNGSEMYPYQISTVEQLQSVNNFIDSQFIQINDINANKTEFWNEGSGFRPIGNSTVRFTGTYNGNGYVIDGLIINRPSEARVGMFGYAEKSKIINTTLFNAKIEGANETGILIGHNDGNVINSVVMGELIGSSNVGGLIGYNDSNGFISTSISKGSVSGSWHIGGLVGHNSLGKIEDSNSETDISITSSIAGGLVGRNVGGSIINSFSKGTMSGESISGGLVGINANFSNKGQIINSYSEVEVLGNNRLGGLIGINFGLVINSYSHGDVAGDKIIGGLIGENDQVGEIKNSYSKGKVMGSEDVGGFIGMNGGSVVSSYWDIIISEKSNGVGFGSSGKLKGLSTSEMTGTPAKENMPEFDWDAIWMTVSGDYPILRWQEE